MKIKIIKESLWTIPRNGELVTVSFKADRVLEAGKDIPADIVADMVKHGYAEKIAEAEAPKATPQPSAKDSGGSKKA